MHHHHLLLATSLFAFATPAAAHGAGGPAAAANDSQPSTSNEPDAAEAPVAQTAAGSDTISTGVAKSRDRLDSAVSTSILRAQEIARIGGRSVGEVLRDIAGLRSEYYNGEGQTGLNIRGLPLSSDGSKFLQLQEDGLPLLQFGDIQGMATDAALRIDQNLSQIEVIRGGSASTFASNSPGGIINFQSKTGEVQGGSVALTSGLDFGLYRLDADYGGHVSESVRFHVGGFYRQGEGPRRLGFEGLRGGQIKANITKDFANGYIRVYGKYLDDTSAFYDAVPMRATGTNTDPKLVPIANFDPRRDTMSSRYNEQMSILDSNNNVALRDLTREHRVHQAAIGLEARFDVAGWTVTERFRYSSMSGSLGVPLATRFIPAQSAVALGGTGASLRYATGPNAGQTIADPSTIGGNGLVALLNTIDLQMQDYGNITNDLRANRVWAFGDNELTATGGLDTARQTIARNGGFITKLSEVRGGGNAALLDLSTATGTPVTQTGVLSYTLYGSASNRRSLIDAQYAILAPFGALNYHFGRVSIGGSLRYDRGNVRGNEIFSNPNVAGVGLTTRDMNGDGVISNPERSVAFTQLNAVSPVNYDYGYWSYSSGINFRVAEPLAVFARYSRGARANADRILSRTFINPQSGALLNPSSAYDPVRQAEAGVKFRTPSLTLNLTGFWTKADDTNASSLSGLSIFRKYKALGLEFEGGYHHGPYSLTGGATYTSSEIESDRDDPTLVGHTPRNQPALLFQAMPQYDNGHIAFGAVVYGQTRIWTQDSNQMRLPGFTLVNGFVEWRPLDHLSLMLNASNLFNTIAVGSSDTSSIPASGIVLVRPYSGRTVSATARLSF